MAEKNFIVRNGLTVSGGITVDSDVSIGGSLTINGASVTPGLDSAEIKTLLSAGTGLSYNSGTGEFSVPASGVVAGTYGSASLVPVITVDAQGFVDSVGEVSVAGVSSTSWDSSTGNLIINTADGGSYYTKVTLDPYTTDNLAEGSTNLYYDSAAVVTAARNAMVGGTGITYTAGTGTIDITNTGVSAATYGDSSTIPRITVNAQGQITAVVGASVNIPAGYDATNFDSDFGTKTTTDLTEGSNLYFTTGRVDAHLSGGTGVTYSSGSISIGQAVATTSDVTFNSVTTTDGLIVGGNLQVNGTTTTVDTENLSVSDNMIYMNDGESAGSPTLSIDVGWAANVNDPGSYQHVGMFRDATDDTFKVFEGYTPEPDDALEINTGHASFSLAPFAARTLTGKYLGADSDIDAHLTGGTGITYSSGDISITNTGVSASTYGDSSTIPVITVNAQGQITAVVGAGVNIPAGYGDADVEAYLSGGTGITFSSGVITNAGVTSVNSVTGAVTATNLLDAIKTVDGAASGLDADLLDGQQGSYYRIDVYNSAGTLLN